MKKCLPLLSALVLNLSTASAQGTVWVVDDDGGHGVDFTLLQDAIDAAANGDILLVKPGTYKPRPALPPKPTSINAKSLIVAADAGSTPRIEDLVVENLGLGGRVTLRGFRFETPQVRIQNNRGVVWIEECDFISPNFTGVADALFVENSDAVHLNRVTSQGGMHISDAGAALAATDSHVHLYDCSMTGAPAYTAIQNGGDGVRATDGFIFASNSSFQGGSGDCGGSGLRKVGNTITLGGTYTPGVSGGCLSGQPGVGVLVTNGIHTVFSGSPRSFHATSPMRVGETATLTFTGQPGDFVFLGQAGASSNYYTPYFRGMTQIELVGHISHFLGALPPSGVLQINVPIAPMTNTSIVLYLQGLMLTPGSGLTVGTASSVLLLPN